MILFRNQSKRTPRHLLPSPRYAYLTQDNIKTQGSGGTNTSSQKLYDRVETQTPSRVVRFPSLVMERPRAAIKNLDDLKNKPDLVRFYIRQKFGADIPCNAKLESYQQGDEQHHKIEKYFKGKGQNEDEVIMFAYLYDDNLREIDGIKYTDSLVAKTNLPRTETRTKIKDLLDVEARSRR